MEKNKPGNAQNGGTDRALTRYITPASALALAIGYAVGWGAFVMPGASFLPGAGPLGTILGVLAGGVVMAIVAWNYHTLMRRRESSGGAFCYVQDAFGSDFGFLVAWFLILAYLAVLWANVTAFALLSRRMLGSLLQVGFHYTVAGFDIYMGEVALATGALMTAGALCILSKRLAVRANLVLVVVLVCGVSVSFAVAVAKNPDLRSAMFPAISPLYSGGIAFQTMHILSMMPWAFVGFEAISNSSAEFRFNSRRAFAVLIVAVAVSAMLYIMMALLPVLSLPEGFGSWPEYIAEFPRLSGPDTLPTFGAARRVLGAAGEPVFFAMMIAALLTGIIGAMIATSRLLQGLAEDRVLPGWIGRLDRDGNPRNAIIIVVLCSAAVPFFGRTAMSWPVDVSSIGAAITYCMTSAAAFRFARAHGDRLTQTTGAIGCVLSVACCLLLLIPNYLYGNALSAESYLILSIWSLGGFMVYRSIFKHNRERFGHAPVVWVGVFVLIFFSIVMWDQQMTKRLLNRSGSDITHFYEERRAGFALMNLDSAAIEREARFMADQIDNLNVKFLEYDLVEVGMLALSLSLMFSLYRTQQYREKTLEVAKVKAEQSNRAKSSFLSNMSHDIRTPMNAIIGYTELARRVGVTEEMLRGYLRKIEASSHHLLALINDALEMSRIEAGKMELEPAAVDLAALVGEVHDMFATQTGVKKVAFEADVSRLRRSCVMCDKNRLNRVLLNLISNAVKFTPEGGRITLSAAQLGDGDGDEGLYELRVKDTGIGMSQQFAAHVFDAFEREKTSTVSGIQGTGLGMAITKSIIDLMKGEISVDTEQGRGTEFVIRLTLPFAPEGAAEAAKAEAAAERPEMDFSSKRLLLVEDNEINREIAATILSDAGFAVEEAVNGQEAVEKVAQGGAGYYDAILMDVHMPVMDGYGATRTIRGMDIPGISDVPIIALSANAFESDVREALEAGMDAHVAKPMKIPVLMAKLAELIAKHAANSHGAELHAMDAARAKAAGKPKTDARELLATLAEIGCDVEGTIQKTFMGNADFYVKMFFKLPANTALKRMREAFDAKDPAALFAASHELKGVYASLGLTPLYDICSEIVEIARPGGLEGAGDPLGRLEELHGEIVALAHGA